MCLGIPGQVVSLEDAGGLRMGRVRFGEIVREACLEYVPGAAVGDYVIVHAGFALNVLSEAEAMDSLEALRELGEFDSDMSEFTGNE